MDKGLGLPIKGRKEYQRKCVNHLAIAGATTALVAPLGSTSPDWLESRNLSPNFLYLICSTSPDWLEWLLNRLRQWVKHRGEPITCWVGHCCWPSPSVCGTSTGCLPPSLGVGCRTCWRMR